MLEQRGLGSGAGLAVEGVKDSEFAGRADPEDGSLVRRISVVAVHAIKVAVTSADQARIRIVAVGRSIEVMKN
jgi:hypothetical protein